MSRLDFTPDQISTLERMRREGMSVKAISEETGINPARVAWYINASENTEKLVLTPEGKIKQVKTDPKEVIRLGYEIIWHNLLKWLQNIKEPDSKPLPPTQLNQLMTMISQIDRIQRLDAGLATENYNFQVLTLAEIRQTIEMIAPPNVIQDARLKVEELKNIDWDNLGQ